MPWAVVIAALLFMLTCVRPTAGTTASEDTTALQAIYTSLNTPSPGWDPAFSAKYTTVALGGTLLTKKKTMLSTLHLSSIADSGCLMLPSGNYVLN